MRISTHRGRAGNLHSTGASGPELPAAATQYFTTRRASLGRRRPRLGPNRPARRGTITVRPRRTPGARSTRPKRRRHGCISYALALMEIAAADGPLSTIASIQNSILVGGPAEGRERRSEGAVPAGPDRRPNHWGVRADRSGGGVRRRRSPHPRDTGGGRLGSTAPSSSSPSAGSTDAAAVAAASNQSRARRPFMAGRLLAEQGHEVVLHARNATRAEDARRALPEAKAVIEGRRRDARRDARGCGRGQPARPLRRRHSSTMSGSAIASRGASLRRTVSHVFAINVMASYVLTALIERPRRLVYLSSGMHHGVQPAPCLDARPPLRLRRCEGRV